MLRVTRVLFFLVLIAVPASAQRLPGNVVPEHYTLWFAPDLEKETFRGRESIDVVLTEPSTTVTLHAAEIDFSDVTITSGGKTARTVSHQSKCWPMNVPSGTPVTNAGQAGEHACNRAGGFFLRH